MSKQNNTLDKILDHELRPWLTHDIIDEVSTYREKYSKFA